MRKNNIISLCLALASLCACVQNPELTEIDELGCVSKTGERFTTDTLSAGAGQYALKVVSNGDFTLTIDENTDWIAFSDDAGKKMTRSGDCTVNFKYEMNRGIPRKAVVVLQKGKNVVDFEFVQSGLLEGGLDIEEKNVAVDAEGGEFGAKVTTKLKPEDFTFSVVYDEEETVDWISNIRLQNNFICFNVQPNFSETDTRHAQIYVTYDGGIGAIHLSQFNVGSTIENITIEQFKALYAEEGSYVVDKHYVVSGIVINDSEENNGAYNRLSSVDSPDMEYSRRIIYSQNEDGTSGIKIIFNENTSLLLSLYDSFGLDTYGLTVEKASEPSMMTITSAPLTSIVESCKGLEPQAREMMIGELTDDDLFTRVMLKDVEIPVRKGNYLPIDIRQYQLVLLYPMVIRDSKGDDMHMVINSNCSWAKDGSEMPYGSGSITGVLVHEPCDNFEWDIDKEKEMIASGMLPDYISGLGYPGRYQIRPIRQADVCLAKDVSESFDSLLVEWRYFDSLGVNLVKNFDEKSKILYPTYPAVEDPLSLDAHFCCIASNSDTVALKTVNDFTHLGPYTYAKTITNINNGNGVYDYYNRTAHWSVASSVAAIGHIASVNGSSWAASNWSCSQYWNADFSTKDIASGRLLNVTFGTMNNIDAYGAPRYWAVEYSLDGTTWKSVKEYTVPDFVVSSYRHPWQMPGPKYVTASLPSETIGQERVWVRLIPAKLSSGTATSYAGSSSINRYRYNAINYFAVRLTR